MGWRCSRKLKKLARIVVPALAGAEMNPVPADLDDTPGIYIGDKIALVLVAKTLYEGKQSWADDPSDCGRVLRDVAGAIEEWRNPPDEPRESTPKEEYHAQMIRDRNFLAVISWLLAGKTAEEIRRL